MEYVDVKCVIESDIGMHDLRLFEDSFRLFYKSQNMVYSFYSFRENPCILFDRRGDQWNGHILSFQFLKP